MRLRTAFWILWLAMPVVWGAAPEYSRDPATWTEVTPPPEARKEERAAWFRAANLSAREWRVDTREGKPEAVLWEYLKPEPTGGPKFTPRTKRYAGGSALAKVKDGWLVAFNEGEFGAALYWFSADGGRCYKVSDHQVVAFFSMPDGIYAIKGLAHMGSWGSVIRVARSGSGARWKAAEVVKLPSAPFTVSARRDGTMLITLEYALVSVGADRKIRTLVEDAPWAAGRRPNSSVLTADEGKLYIGMRQLWGNTISRREISGCWFPPWIFRNARSVRRHHEEAGTLHPANPSTEVDRLAGALNDSAPPHLRKIS